MRVTAEQDFTAVITGGQMLTVKRGDMLKGDVARYLLDTGAAVTTVEAEEQAVEQVEVLPDPVIVEGLDVKAATIDAVLAWVDGDTDRALEAHELEESKGDKARPRLLAALVEIVGT
jgi:hypothetical protein